MGIGIRKFELIQPATPLPVGEHEVSIEFIGIVDEANENDVSVTVTIDEDAPIVFKDTMTKQIAYTQTFPIKQEGSCSNNLAIKVQTASTVGAAAKFSFVYTTIQGKKRKRYPSVIY